MKVIKRNKKKRKISSAQWIAGSFAIIILIGAILLSLPIASTGGKTNFLDALFVAVSATCVTGLTTVNTAAHWTLFGRTVILILIEIGGMSFLLISLMIFFIGKKKAKFSTRIVIKDYMNMESFTGVFQVAKSTMLIAGVIQGLGAFFLMFYFVPKVGFVKGLGFSIFHAISAFCNAGFDLFGNSLEGATREPYLLMVLALLVVAGGIGFVVWKELLKYRQTKKLSMHSSLTFKTNMIILVASFLLFFLFERGFGNHESNLNIVEKISNIFFLAVTPRTAGFNNIPYTDVTIASLLLTMILMFIGGNSGSTAGGLKVSTIAVLFLSIRDIVLGKQHTSYRERTIKKDTIYSSFALFFLGLILIASATMLLAITEEIPAGFGIEYIVFEVFSAFGTVGVTMGLTPDLTTIGKLTIMTVMFIGRIGIYTFIFSLVKRRNNSKDYFKYPEEVVMVG